MTLLLLGDQLALTADPVADADEILLVEAHGFAGRKPFHPHKLTLLFSAMRHARDDLRDAGYDVTYVRAETFGEGLDAAVDDGDELTLMRPASHGAVGRLRDLVTDRGGTLDVVPNPCFCTTPETFDEWAADGNGSVESGFRQEGWYRHVRRETGVLMDGDDPVGGQWNYDEENRETPPDDWEPPPVPTFEVDETTREVHAWVTERYDDHWGNPSLAAFRWPVTRAQARDALDHFVTHRLDAFGPYQDAMVRDSWSVAHSLLSSSLNLGLLRPMAVVDAAVDAYEAGDARLNSVEGFVRQILGWREFVRHVYRRAMPEMASANQLDQTRRLPPLYWGDDTDMACLSDAVAHVHERGYAHHIERLMLLSNFALVYGADPAELNEWFHVGFVDAVHWVTTPNVVGMGSFGTDVLSSKPYASSANYVARMSDYCEACPYDPDATTGDGACPFNALYWDFLREHEDVLRGTGRMGLVYAHADDKSDDEWAEIRDRAAALRERAREGDI